MKQRQERLLRADVGQVLLEDWDPIGVRDESAAQDEYNGYVSGIIRLIVDGASERDIANYLYQNETVSMGLSCSDRERLLPIAQKLRGLLSLSLPG